MTKAASFLNVAQPALGLQIRQLEESLGSLLLTRHSRGVEATPAGRLLFERAQQILRLVDDTRSEMRALAGPITETVRVGVTEAIMNLIGYDLLVESRQDIPQAFLSITAELGYLLLDAVKRHELDIALIFETDDSPQIISEPIYEEELLFVTSAAGAPRTPITFEEAVSIPLVLPWHRVLIRKLVEQRCEEFGLKLRLSYEVNSPTAIRTILLRETCSTIIPFGIVADDLERGLLSARRITPVLARTMYVVRPSNGRPIQQHAAISAFIHRMAAKLAERVGIYMRPIAPSVAPAVSTSLSRLGTRPAR